MVISEGCFIFDFASLPLEVVIKIYHGYDDIVIIVKCRRKTFFNFFVADYVLVRIVAVFKPEFCFCL